MRKLLGILCLIIMLAGTGLASESAVDVPEPVTGGGQSDPARTIRLTPSAGPGDHLFFEGVEMVLAANVPEIGSENEDIRVVTYLVNDKPVVRSLKSPYVAVWKPQPGTYTLRARARYTDGSESLSDPMTVMVAKHWGYPDWVEWGAVSPYSDEDEGAQRKDESNLPPPEDLAIDGVSSTPKLTILPVDFRVSEDNEWPPKTDPSIWSVGAFPAYKVVGHIPDEGARISLPIAETHNLRVDYITMLQHGPDTGDWSILPSEVHLDPDLYAVATAQIDTPGIYCVGVFQDRRVDGQDTAPIVGLDEEAPEISWILPAQGEIISGETRLVVAASDNVGIRDVEFYLGGENFLLGGIELGRGLEDGGWYVDVDFSNYAAGTHVLQATAEDASGIRTSAFREVVLDTNKSAPQLTVDTPYYDSELGYVVFKGTVWDDDTTEFRDAVRVFLMSTEEEPWTLTCDPNDAVGGLAMVEVDQSGIITWQGGLPFILPGDNLVLISAHDEHENQTNVWMQVSLPLSKVGLIVEANTWTPVLQDTSIELNAQAFGGAGPTEYKYEVNDGTGWTLIRDYQVEPDRYPSNWCDLDYDDVKPHCTWAAGPPGEYTIRVTARDHGTTEPEVSAEESFTVVEPFSGVSLSADPASPQPTGSLVVFSAERVDGRKPEYQFEVFDGA